MRAAESQEPDDERDQPTGENALAGHRAEAVPHRLVCDGGERFADVGPERLVRVAAQASARASGRFAVSTTPHSRSPRRTFDRDRGHAETGWGFFGSHAPRRVDGPAGLRSIESPRAL